MSLEKMQAVQNYTATERLFGDVLCPSESLITRATTVAFGSVLLIGTLFAIYSIISNGPTIGKKAIQFIRSLRNRPKFPLNPRYFFKTAQPVTNKVFYLERKRVKNGYRLASKPSLSFLQAFFAKTNNQTAR